jgi:large subunit ribosomal protein L5e
MGKRKSKKRSNSTLKVTSYFKRFQVKFARRRAGA